MKDDFDLTGRVALVTGAGVGIGRAIVLKLAEHGAKVVIHCHTSREKAAGVLSEVRRGGSDGLVIAADLTRPDEARRPVDQAVEHFGRLDILVNNAGSVPPRRRGVRPAGHAAPHQPLPPENHPRRRAGLVGHIADDRIVDSRGDFYRGHRAVVVSGPAAAGSGAAAAVGGVARGFCGRGGGVVEGAIASVKRCCGVVQDDQQ